MRSRLRSRFARRALLGAGVAVGLAALALPATAAKDDLDYVSRATGGAPANGASSLPSISGGGERVAFRSAAPNISGVDVDGVTDIFVRDLAAGTTIFASRATGPGGAAGDANSTTPDISGDGRFVAFASSAQNLAPDDDKAVQDIFVRDLVNDLTFFASRATGPGGAASDGISFGPSISADGRKVAFTALSDGLSGDDNNTDTDVYVRDLVDNTTTLVSRADGAGGAVGNGGSGSAAISPDGRYVAFQSVATNLTAEAPGGIRQVFVRDLVANTTTLVSRADGPAGAVADTDAGAPAISTDGRFISFTSRANNLSGEDLDPNEDVFVRDLVANTTIYASRGDGAAGAAADGGSFSSSISGDGRHVSFQSDADNLSAEDDNAAENEFVRDLVANTTTYVTRAAGPNGAPADNSDNGEISGDGRFVAFSSSSDNLSLEDDNTVANIFRRDVFGPPPPPPPPLPPPPPPPAPPVAPVETQVPAQTPSPVVLCAGRTATIVGTNGNDVINGTPANDVIASLGGNDLVRGAGGNDIICLGNGNDRGLGGTGTDRILGGSGDDRIDGGSSSDILDGGAGNDRLRGQSAGDTLLGRAGRDVLLGGSGNDRAFGHAGRDRISGGAGNDRMIGGPGLDIVLGGAGRDLARGGPGNDRLLGNSGNDRLFGQAGRDRLVGGAGIDRANGGPGNDSCATSEIIISC